MGFEPLAGGPSGPLGPRPPSRHGTVACDPSVITTDRLPVAAAAAAIVAAAKALAAQTEGEPTYRRLRQDHYTIREAADLLMLNPDVIRHAVVAGELPAARTGRTISTIRRQELLRWLEQETVRT